MIEKISVTNFKSQAHTEIELGRVTALVGPNGCGKTSILQAAHHASRFAKRCEQDWFQGKYHPQHLTRKGQNSWTISFSGQIETIQWEVSVKFDTANHPIAREYANKNDLPFVEWRVGDTSGYRAKLESGHASSGTSHPVLSQILATQDPADLIAGSVYFKAIADNLATPSYSDSVSPVLAPDGSGLASVIANLILTDRAKHAVIEQALTAIVPTVSTFSARPAKVIRKERKIFSVNNAQFPYEEERDVIGHEIIFDTRSAHSLTADLMSEGTLIVLGILALLYNQSPTGLILLDDIEQGLHPLAQRRLMDVLKDFAEKHQRQILLTTHSPYIVDELEPKYVWVMATDNAGVTYAKRLSDHPDVEDALSVLTTGEVWGAEGEDWVLPKVSAGEPVNA